jgi:3,4-dihydroxy 2-butanone 4-phosphate synthase / GTP cyclohydrolase II
MVRVHSECLTGDAIGSLRCDCRMQLQAALKMIESAGQGVVVYLRQEGRGIGLVNKLKAYSLQDMGLDTVEANERLGFPADLRNYGVGAQILNDLQIRRIRLITNNPRKIAGLKGYGLEVTGRVPLLIESTPYNVNYLDTKAEKLGHMLLQTFLVTLGISWREGPQNAQGRYEHLEALRQLVIKHHLLLREEARPVGKALFEHSELIAHIGLDQADVAAPDWFSHPDHPYVLALTQIIDALLQEPHIARIEFLLSAGADPLKVLQSQLDRKRIRPDQLLDCFAHPLSLQQIYSLEV